MRFKIGQEVVCIKKGSWSTIGFNGPKFNEIVTVSGYNVHYAWGIILKEYPYAQGFDESKFEPVLDIKELVEILQSEPIEI